MLEGLAGQDIGLLNIKIVPFLLLLLPALAGPLPSTPRPPGRAPTPWLDKPKSHHKRDEDPDHPQRVPSGILDRVRRKATGTPVRRRLEDDFDDDDEKENQPPNGENNEKPIPPDHLTRLLRQWGEDIEWLKEKVSQDLDDYKKRLGIPPLFA